MKNCVFCDIVKGTEPASMVYSDDKVMAFLDVQPINPGHTLIIPKKHAILLPEVNEETATRMFIVAKHIDSALRESGLKCEGVNLWLADGEAAFQDVFHVHLHLIPRFKGDGFGIRAGDNYGTKPSRGDLDEIAANIRKALF